MTQIICSVTDLLSKLGLNQEKLPYSVIDDPKFPVRTTQSFVDRMKIGDAYDPLLLQVLPNQAENVFSPHFSENPVRDAELTAAPGVIHKYANRALLIATGTCHIHCRYCFRKAYLYDEQKLTNQAPLKRAIEYLSCHDELSEVILSGGDPLTLSTQRLSYLLDAIADIPHIKRIRIHSRQPIVDAQTIDKAIITRLAQYAQKIVLVVHSNHANELDDNTQQHLAHWAKNGITILNQAVLLKGINDNVEAQVALCERLFDCHALPYYLNLLDKVIGSQHFDVGIEPAKRLITDMRERLPGYLVPRLVLDESSRHSKSIMA